MPYSTPRDMAVSVRPRTTAIYVLAVVTGGEKVKVKRIGYGSGVDMEKISKYHNRLRVSF